MKIIPFAALFFIVAATHAGAVTDEEIRKLKVDMMVHTKLIAVEDYKGPASAYKSDGDPDTLEIVFLGRPEDGPSHVSDDGEVIFLNNATNDEMQSLTDQAFDIRARKKLSGP